MSPVRKARYNRASKETVPRPTKRPVVTWRYAGPEEALKLAEWNLQLIRDEGHRNRMTVPELAERLRKWLAGEYQAVIFSLEGPEDIGYALYRRDADAVYLRHYFVVPKQRRRGYGRGCFHVLRGQIWPRDLRLVVEVLSQNAAGIAFWRAMGYTDYCLTLEIMPDGRRP